MDVFGVKGEVPMEPGNHYNPVVMFLVPNHTPVQEDEEEEFYTHS